MRFLVLACAIVVAKTAKLEGYVSQQSSVDSNLIQHISSSNFPDAIDTFQTGTHLSQPELIINNEIHPSSSSGPVFSNQPASALIPVYSTISVTNPEPIFLEQPASNPGTLISDHSGNNYPSSVFSDEFISSPVSSPEPIFYDQIIPSPGREIHSHDLSSSVSQPFEISSNELSLSIPGLSEIGTSLVNEPNQIQFSNQQFSGATSQIYTHPPVSQQLDQSAAQVITSNTGILGQGNSFVDEQASLTFSSAQSFGQNPNVYSGGDGSSQSCPGEQIRHITGRCVTPQVSRHVFVYTAPEREYRVPGPPKNIPLPKIEHNIVFIRAPVSPDAEDPIIIPPPQKKHIIYVLSKESEIQEPKVIEVPAPKSSPEVYFVNYAEGENPTLPGGIDFEDALNSAVHSPGQVFDGSNDISLSGRGNLIHRDFGVSSDIRDGLFTTSNGGLTIGSDLEFTGENLISHSEGPSTIVKNSGIDNSLLVNSVNGIKGFSIDNLPGPIAFNSQVPQTIYTSS